jgi:TRAP-type C4-dicarboxylate transport system permease small subunit
MIAEPNSTVSVYGRILRVVANTAMLLACLSLATLVLLFVAVIGSRLVGMSVPSADDFAGILLGGTLALGFAAAVPGDQHISVDYFIDRMGDRGSAMMRAIGYLVMIGIIGYLTLGFFRMWYAAYLSGITMLGTLPIPRAVPMGVVLAGLILLELALVLRFLERATGKGFGRQPSDIMKGAH